MQPLTPKRKRRRSAWRRRISIAPTTRSWQSRSRSSRGTEATVDVSSYLEWPFFGPEHGELVRRVDAWAKAYFANWKISEDRDSVDRACRQLVSELGRAGWTRYSVPGSHAHLVGGADAVGSARSAGAVGSVGFAR